MRRGAAVWLLAVLLLSGPGAWAVDGASGIDEAAQLLRGGRTLDAYRRLRQAIDELAPRVDLTVLRSVLVRDDPEGNGLYEPRMSNRYAAGERILIYGDIVGFSTRSEEGRNKVALTFDYVLTAQDGEIVAGKKGFGAWEQESWSPITETSFHLAYEFSGLTPGVYEIETVVHDAVSGEEASMVVPIEILADPATGDGPGREGAR